MPADGMPWWHVIISTWNSWLPGDERGFRSRDHKIHSSGDYKNPPPVEEHAGLRIHHEKKANEPAIIPPESYETVGRAILDKLKKLGYRVLAISVSATHSHWLVELPDRLEEVRLIVGQCKSKSSHAIRDRIPGRVWAFRGSFKRVKDRGHHRNVYRYILNQADAWIWDYAKEDAEETIEKENEEEAQG